MQKNSPPSEGLSPEALEAQKQELSKKVEDYQAVFNAQISKATIIITASKDGAGINRAFVFDHDSGIPPELYGFFEIMTQRYITKLLRYEVDNHFIRVNNQVVSTKLFLQDYTAGDIPLLSKQDADKIKALSAGQSCTVVLGAEEQHIQRIS